MELKNYFLKYRIQYIRLKGIKKNNEKNYRYFQSFHSLWERGVSKDSFIFKKNPTDGDSHFH